MMNEWELLRQIQAAYQEILSDKLTGIYVHGSIAFGCFLWENSDIDFLAVVESSLTQTEKEALIRTLLELDAFAPAKGFEMSVILRSACMPFADPTPYELHYSNAYRANYQRNLAETCQMLQGYDPDLAAHITVLNHTGITLCGLAKEQVFAQVPKESYLRSLWYDIEGAENEIDTAPVYFTLNLCRILAYLQTGRILSKKQGGEWGLIHLSQDAPIIRAALTAYCTGVRTALPSSGRTFAQKMLERIRQNAVFLGCPTKNN